jgi:ACS family hexuronate transporter-like MFS transporter
MRGFAIEDQGLRWWMITLIMLGAILNYLTRSTLAVAAPTILQDLGITAREYSWITAAFQGAIMLQPLCGYVLDVVGLKLGFALFAFSWSLISMAHGLAGSWQAFAWLRGLLGLAEGSANPAGMKATAEWFPARERGSRAASSTSGPPWARCSPLRSWPGRSSSTTGSPPS